MNFETLKFPIGQYIIPNEISEETKMSWIEIIQDFPSKIEKITNPLTAEKLNWIYRPDGWKIKQVIHHCADSHSNAFIRFKLALTEDNPTIKPYTESFWAELCDSQEDDLTFSIMMLKGIHHRWTILLKSINEENFNKTYYHPEADQKYKLIEVLGLYAWHCNHHFAHIEQALKFKNNFKDYSNE